MEDTRKMDVAAESGELVELDDDEAAQVSGGMAAWAYPSDTKRTADAGNDKISIEGSGNGRQIAPGIGT